MCPSEIKNVSSQDDGKLTCEADHNTANNLSHEINLMNAFPLNRRGHRRAHSDITTLHDGTIADLNAQDDSIGDDGIRSEPVSSDEPDDDSLPIPFNKQQRLRTSLAFDLNSNASSGAADAADHVVSAPPVENEDQHKLPADTDHTVHAGSDTASPSNGFRAVPLRRLVSAEKLAEIARVDPRRARRILSNRQSAARSKQRKIQYRMELGMKVNALKLEAASLNARLAAMQKQMEVVDAENFELKLKSQTIEQQVQLQEALNDALRKEIEYLKILTRDIIPNSEVAARIGSLGTGQNQQFHANHIHAANNIPSAQQLQQNRIASQLEEHQLQLNQLGRRLMRKDGNGASTSSGFKKE